MANHKTGKNLICPNCGKEFYIIRCRIPKSKIHYCSLLCLARYTAKDRGDRQRQTVYPKICGICRQCKKDIIAKNASFDKSNRKYCSKHCQTIWQNINLPQSANRRLRSAQRCRNTFLGKPKSMITKLNMSKANQGKRSHFWRGGLTDKNRLLRSCAKTKQWKKDVLQRDNWTCQDCGIRGGKLEVDHIKSWSTYPKLRWNLDNGRTLCRTCHRKTDTFGSKNNRFKKFIK